MTLNERRKRASAEAAEWWALSQSEDFSKQQKERFVDWLQESKLHVAELLLIAQVHEALELFNGWPQVSTDGDENENNVVAILKGDTLADFQAPNPIIGPRANSQSKWRLGAPQRWAAVALMVSIVVCIALWSRGQVIVTERGERREVSLSDGSIVDVDPETYLQVQFDKQARRITLYRGSSFFHVSKDATRPFLVRSGHTFVKAVGTAFGVDQSSPLLIVTVEEGTVAVSQEPTFQTIAVPRDAVNRNPKSSESSPISATTAVAAPDPLLVTAGQQVSVEPLGEINPVKHVDSQRELAWVAGRLVFDNNTVADAVAQFNRYNHIQIRILDDALSRQRISGVFNSSQPESFVAFLQGMTADRVIRADNHDIVLVSPDVATR